MNDLKDNLAKKWEDETLLELTWRIIILRSCKISKEGLIIKTINNKKKNEWLDNIIKWLENQFTLKSSEIEAK